MTPRKGRRVRFATAGLIVLVWLVSGIPVPAQESGTQPAGDSQTDKERIRALEQPADKAAAQQSAVNEADRARIRILEEEVARLIAEIAALQARMDEQGKSSRGVTIEELQKQVEALTQEVARLSAPAETPGGERQTYGGMSAGASRVYFAKKGLTFGGYGSGLFESFTSYNDNNTVTAEPNRADLTEAFFYVGYRFDDRFVFNSSLGIEHAVVEDGGNGKAAVEFAYLDYKVNEHIGARGGLVLMPIGFLNERHEPGDYLGARRPEVETRLLPSTWRELGGGVYGDAGPVQWRGYLVTSLDAAGFSPDTGVAGGRQQGSEAEATDLGWTARVDWWVFKEKSFGTLVAGSSAFTGETGQRNPGFPPGRFSLWEMHADYRWKALQARALWARGIQSDAGELSLALDPSGNTAIGERMEGWYLEGGFNVLSWVPSTHQELIAFARYEDVDTQERVAPGMSADPANDLTLKTIGLQYQPIPPIVIKLEAQNFDERSHTKADQINLGFGWSF
ncbi:MAG TPA: hypothetical protein VFB49_00135 [Patescibacteria group bacterium]|nr:hypothetical protein [Patescibacteria group bacterium]